MLPNLMFLAAPETTTRAKMASAQLPKHALCTLIYLGCDGRKTAVASLLPTMRKPSTRSQQSTDRFSGRSIERPIDTPIDLTSDRPSDQARDRTDDQSIDRLTKRPTERSSDRSNNRSSVQSERFIRPTFRVSSPPPFGFVVLCKHVKTI